MIGTVSGIKQGYAYIVYLIRLNDPNPGTNYEGARTIEVPDYAMPVGKKHCIGDRLTVALLDA